MIIIIIVLQLNNNNNSNNNNNNNIIIISNRNTPFKNLNAPTSEKETAKKKENNWLKQLNYEGIIAQCGDGDEKGKF